MRKLARADDAATSLSIEKYTFGKDGNTHGFCVREKETVLCKKGLLKHEFCQKIGCFSITIINIKINAVFTTGKEIYNKIDEK